MGKEKIADKYIEQQRKEKERRKREELERIKKMDGYDAVKEELVESGELERIEIPSRREYHQDFGQLAGRLFTIFMLSFMGILVYVVNDAYVKPKDTADLQITDARDLGKNMYVVERVGEVRTETVTAEMELEPANIVEKDKEYRYTYYGMRPYEKVIEEGEFRLLVKYGGNPNQVGKPRPKTEQVEHGGKIILSEPAPPMEKWTGYTMIKVDVFNKEGEIIGEADYNIEDMVREYNSTGEPQYMGIDLKATEDVHSVSVEVTGRTEYDINEVGMTMRLREENK